MTTFSSSTPIPILLLKTKSIPNDGYEDEFSTPQDGLSFAPTFVPVLEHNILNEGMSVVCSLLLNRQIGLDESCKYGGMIFTSQRAVEAFALLISENKSQDKEWPYLAQTPIYTVGPATSRALSSIPSTPPLSIFGKETGNGEALAHYILSHYPSLQPTSFSSTTPPNTNANTNKNEKPLPLLFLVGETRRDIIPKTLTSNHIPVTEIPVYGTTIKSSFESTFSAYYHTHPPLT